MPKEKKKTLPPKGIPVAVYELKDGGILTTSVNPTVVYRCPFCGLMMRGHAVERHIRMRLLNDLDDAIGECRALQLSHHHRLVASDEDSELNRRAREEHLSRVRTILKYGDPYDW